MNGFPSWHILFIRFHGGCGAQLVNSLKIFMGTELKLKPKNRINFIIPNHPHLETDLDNNSDQTLFPGFIVHASTEDTPINKLSLYNIEKTLSSMIKLKSVRKLANETLLLEVTKKTYSDLLLEQKSFYNLKIKTYPLNSLNSSKKSRQKINIYLPHKIFKKTNAPNVYNFYK